MWKGRPRGVPGGHLLRLWYDAIAVGRGTVDNPTLNPRLSQRVHRTPRRLILDTKGTLAVPDVLGRLNAVRHEPGKTLWVLGADLAKLATDTRKLAADDAVASNR